MLVSIHPRHEHETDAARAAVGRSHNYPIGARRQTFWNGRGGTPPYHWYCWLLLSPELPNAACAQTVRQSRSLLMGRLSTEAVRHHLPLLPVPWLPPPLPGLDGSVWLGSLP